MALPFNIDVGKGFPDFNLTDPEYPTPTIKICYADNPTVEVNLDYKPEQELGFDMRSLVEYDSIINNGTIPENGFWTTFSIPIGRVYKIIKPYNCQKITIEGTYYDPLSSEEDKHVKTHLYMDFSNCIDVPMVITYSNIEDTTISFENYYHTSDVENYKNDGIRIISHDTQINGSNFGISSVDYLDDNKIKLNKLSNRGLQELMNFSMSRAFQKFYIGSFLK